MYRRASSSKISGKGDQEVVKATSDKIELKAWQALIRSRSAIEVVRTKVSAKRKGCKDEKDFREEEPSQPQAADRR
jgi:hypothetical protein